MKKLLKTVILLALGFFAATFAAFMLNADMKLVEKIYDALMRYHDSRHVVEKI